MFVHVAKDFMKKLDDLETRLSVSLDKDEIHTLGLKLRFYYNEIKHYQTLMREIHDRILSIQKKFGFKPEEKDPAAADLPALQPQQPAPQQRQPVADPPPPQAAPAAPQGQGQDVIKLLADWVMKLQKQGHSPQQALAMARDYIRNNSTPKSLDVSLPGETPFDRPPSEPGAPGPGADETPEQAIPKSEPESSSEAPADGEQGRPIAQDDPPAQKPAAPPEEEHTTDPETPAQEAAGQQFEDDANSAGDPVSQQEPEPDEESLPLMDLLSLWSREIIDSEPPPDLSDRINELLKTRRVEIHMQLEDMTEALKTDINGGPNASGFSLFCMGYFAYRLGREGLAITLMDKSISEGTAFSLSFLVLGHCYQAKRIAEKALINFKFADKLDPTLEEARLGIAKAQLALNKYEEALDYLAEQNFDIEENQVDSILLQSHALEKLGRLPVAVDLLEQTVQTCRSVPCTAACLFRLGRIKEQQKDILKAIDLYEETVESDPDHLEARFNLGRLYLRHKAVPLARKHLYYLTRNHPESQWADKAREIV